MIPKMIIIKLYPKNSRNKMARIYVMSNNKLIGGLKSTDNNTDNAN